ncbi:Alkyl hydroperoxide reductase E [Pseudoclavibacter triregionum]|nr:Alkyl hydroperoxide reductase E [Pseudoclavibacter triregionum]
MPSPDDLARTAPLIPGDRAAGIVAETHRGGRFRGDAPGARTLLVFIPAAYTPVCGQEVDELLLLRERAVANEVELAVASCDSTAVLAAWLREHGADDALLGVSDFWPHGALARAFGAFDERSGQARRVSFAVAQDGAVCGSVASPPGEPRTLAQHALLLRRLGS